MIVPDLQICAFRAQICLIAFFGYIGAIRGIKFISCAVQTLILALLDFSINRADMHAQYIRYLAGGLASMVNLLRPQAIIVGGGVSNAGDALLEPLRREMNLRVYSAETLPPPPVIQARLGNDAGVIGAALLGV